jgi:hypothetical protein
MAGAVSVACIKQAGRDVWKVCAGEMSSALASMWKRVKQIGQHRSFDNRLLPSL